jgi:ATP-dependent RNA helicase DeaD
MERFRIEVGYRHGVKPGNIVGAIANEAGLDSQHIGHIDIHTEYSTVDLPLGMPREVFQDLRKARVCGQRLNISRSGKHGKQRKGGHKGKKQKKTKS